MISEPDQPQDGGLDEEQYWTAFQQGRIDAFHHLYQRHIQALFDYGMHFHADADLVKDALQEMFVRLWQRRGMVASVKNVRGYLMVSLRREIIAHLEIHKKWRAYTREAEAGLQGVEDSPENQLMAKEVLVEQEQDLKLAIGRLPPRQREIIYLLFYRKLPQKEIATLMSINLASVYTLTSKAIKSLKAHLKE